MLKEQNSREEKFGNKLRGSQMGVIWQFWVLNML